MRKALQAEMGKVETERKIKELDSDKHDLERQCNELKNKCEQVERRGVELRLVYYIIIIVLCYNIVYLLLIGVNYSNYYL